MQEVQDQIEAAGATLLALCPQLAEKTQAMVEKHDLTFDILTDAGNDYAAELGIKFQVPDEVKKIYEGFGLDLPGTNGDDSWTLPMPSRLVIEVVITGLDPVIHVWRQHDTRGWPGLGPAMTQSFYASAAAPLLRCLTRVRTLERYDFRLGHILRF